MRAAQKVLRLGSGRCPRRGDMSAACTQCRRMPVRQTGRRSADLPLSSQTAALPARNSCQRRGLRTHIIRHRARNHLPVLANRRPCSHCSPMTELPGFIAERWSANSRAQLAAVREHRRRRVADRLESRTVASFTPEIGPHVHVLSAYATKTGRSLVLVTQVECVLACVSNPT